MKPHQPLVEQLFEEMKGRIKEDESSVPIRDGDWLYWWAFKPGAQYRSWYRRPVGGGDEQLIFDEPAEAEGKDYFRLGALEVSPDGRLIATMVDDNGSERFTLRIRDIASGKDVETVTDVAIGSPVWTSDSAGVVFTEVNDNWRSYRARYHRLGTPVDGRPHALRGDRGSRLFGRRRRIAGPQPDLHRDRRQYDQRSALRAVDRPAGRAGAGFAAPAGPRIFGRRRARQIVDRHQRRPCEFPPGRGRPGRARRMDDGDPRLRPRLSAPAMPPTATISRCRSGSTASISWCCAHIRARRRGSRSTKPATAPASPAIRSSRRTPTGSLIRRWSGR